MLVVVTWALSGPYYRYSDMWRWVIEPVRRSSLMVFLFRHTQNRDAKANDLKLNGIAFAMRRAKKDLIDAEKMSDEELEEQEAKYARTREICEMRREKRKTIPS